MGIFRQFPYTNFHDLNLDWLLKNMRNLLTEWAEYQEKWNVLYDDITTAFEDFKSVFDEHIAGYDAEFRSFIDSIDVNRELRIVFEQAVGDGTIATIINPIIASETARWLSEHITEPTGVIIDKTLTIDGACADAKATGDADFILKNRINNEIVNRKLSIRDSILDFTDLKNGVAERYEAPFPIAFGWISADGIIHESSNDIAYSDYFSVNEGDYITSLGSRRDAIRFVCAYDSNYTPIQSAGSDSLIYSYKVPAGVSYIRITLYTNDVNSLYSMPMIKIMSTRGYYAIKEIENVTELKKNVTFNLNKTITAKAFGWINASGVAREDSDEVLAYSEFIKVNAGDIIKSNNPNRTNIRFVASYDAKQTIVPSAGSDNIIASYTVPAGIEYVIVTLWVETPHVLSSMPSVNITRSGNYILPIVDDTLTSNVYPAPANIVGQIYGGANKQKSITKRGNLGLTEAWTFDEINICNGKIYTFSADISNFNALLIGQGKTEQEGNYIKIDNTNVYEYLAGNVINTYPHGLTIANNIQINILNKNENSYTAYLTLTSNGIEFKQSMPRWYADSGTIFVENVGSAMTNCSFGYSCINFNKPVYIFGDSYIGYATNNRWPYYLIRDSFAQLIDGYAGRNSIWAYRSLENILKYATPKYILWCMGMNDPDNGSANSNWLTRVQMVENLCEKYGIKLILATIPNVLSASKDNTYKNIWVKNSGYRYVDFASAVGGENVGSTWFDGMLDSDGLHPTTKGAVALYNQVLADFPEIVITE